MLTRHRAILGGPGIAIIVVLSIALGFSLALNLRQARPPVLAAPVDLEAMKDWRAGFAPIADKLAPSVVYIVSEKTVQRPTFPDLDDFFDFGPLGPRRTPRTQPRTERASGSGVVVRSDGYILTNNHVVAGADRVDVRLPDGREFKGKVFLDPKTDLALVKIEADGLPAAELADSDEVKVGQWAIAIGSPFRLKNTVTVGVVSAVRKEVDPNDPLPYAEVIQTDASINFGNSGGPLADISGKVIGINGAIYSTSGGNVGIGFAIPSNTAKYVMKQLIEKGKVVRGFLGIEMQDLSPTLADKLGAKQGALVTSVKPDSAAKKGGIQVKDVIVKVDGKPVDGGATLRRVVEVIPPGTEVEVVVVRDKKQKVLKVKLGEWTEEAAAAGTGDGEKIGLSVQPLTPDLASQLGVDPELKGVVVRKVEAGGAADRAGVKVNDVVVEIDNDPITSVASFAQAVGKLKSGDTAIVVVQRAARSVILEMSID